MKLVNKLEARQHERTIKMQVVVKFVVRNNHEANDGMIRDIVRRVKLQFTYKKTKSFKKKFRTRMNKKLKQISSRLSVICCK
jgi:hypothetical protein